MHSRWILLIGIVGLIVLMALAYLAVQLEDQRLARAPTGGQTGVAQPSPAPSAVLDAQVGVPLRSSEAPPESVQVFTPSPSGVGPAASGGGMEQALQTAPEPARPAGSAELAAIEALIQEAHRRFEPQQAMLGPSIVEPLKRAAVQLMAWRQPVLLEVQAPSATLAQERAWALRDYLVVRGVDPNLIRYVHGQGPEGVRLKVAYR
ncbi:MAG: hypothetical protein N2561_05310 [Bacteroidetes bacterium]|nr:hypothetical protein [Rhodothermia bacterium]MCX7906940.1 hypothetical protein [Bacteroidota bacterium]MDW8137696.1 hypothetical protein [Bacteroidota bacterium]MDW8285350.1 hypothetical protein [Bacteroidota bacterium]